MTHKLVQQVLVRRRLDTWVPQQVCMKQLEPRHIGYSVQHNILVEHKQRPRKLELLL
ncbi:hypothetical protein DAPPUDRAFT_301351 [Daphnia pulex]|uniref:Uncharacterized protein n=1 Tax=Daphnia pulex TaxID=6669 RepID=E9G908_DAPPU|nr:hypothetical protein DAPPUDRAFT_301351 [Daphnia pulex]|eukprot:EFX84179.1 hypothetical protein DAPPUDRAFT_301351 [Daphnia pulex]